MAALTIREGLGRNLTPDEVDGNFLSLNAENASQQTAINSKAPLDGAALTGTPTAPTPAANDNSSRIANTAWFIGQASDADPLPNAETPSPGTSSEWARADHVHEGGAGGGAAAQNSLTPGSTTVPPSVDAVVSGLATKANAADLVTQIDALSATLSSQIGGKQNQLTVTGLAELTGDVLNVSAARVAGDLFDGQSAYMLPSSSTFTTAGVNGISTTGSTYANLGPANPTNVWNQRVRARLQGTAGAANFGRVYAQMKQRFPDSASTTLGGFKFVTTVAVGDALSATAFGFYGVVQTIPSLGVAPSAYTGARFGFAYEAGDTNLKVWAGTTLVKDLGANFPAHSASEANPYLIEIDAQPGPSFGIRWKITHLISGNTDSGFHTGTYNTLGIPPGTFEPNFILTRDSGTGTTAATITTQGMLWGAYRQLVIGDASGQIPTPNRITTSTTLQRLPHANTSNRVAASSPVTLTVKATGFGEGDLLYGLNRGTSTIAFAMESGGNAIVAGPDVPTLVDPGEAWALEYDAVDNVWTRTA